MLHLLPHDILLRIAFELALADQTSNPYHLTPLLQTCRYLNNALSKSSCHDLYADIFKAKFDTSAPLRRFGAAALYSSNLTEQLVRYCRVLKHIRRADIYSPTILEDFWMAFIMMTENDGRNERQLAAAGLADYVEHFVLERLWERRESTNLWPAESTINALALWLMWLTTDLERLTAEFREEAEAREEAEQRQDPDFTQNSKRKAILDLLRPYILVSTRYPSFHAPDNHFNFPLHPATQDQLPFSLLTPHGIWPLYRRPEDVVSRIPHFTGTIALSHPLITVAAKLLYLARREAQPIQVPPTLIVDRPTALAQGRTGVFPTQADIIEFNRYRGSQFVDKGNWDEWKDGLTLEELHAEASSIWLPTLKCLSSKWDPDWTRLISCIDPWDNSPFKRAVHMYGVLDGLWHGRMLMPDEGSYFRIANTVSLPSEFGESFPFVTTVPVMVRLREHHCIRPAKAVEVPEGDEPDELFDEGVRNGWLPGGTKFREDGRKLEVQDQHGRILATYETYRPGRPNSHSEDTCDVCCARIGAADEAMMDRFRERNFQQQDEDLSICDDSMDVDGDTWTESEDDEYTEIHDEFIEPLCTGIHDIVITGETLHHHGQAWQHYYFYGRVRPWDGLISLVRVPKSNPANVYIFRGYIHGGKNFVGTWRARTSNIHSVPMEGPFSLGKRMDEPDEPIPSCNVSV